MPRPEWAKVPDWLRRKKVDRNVLITAAQRALQQFWSTPGMQGAGVAADACRKLEIGELRTVGAWIPAGGNGTVAVRCRKAREIVDGVIAEKQREHN